MLLSIYIVVGRLRALERRLGLRNRSREVEVCPYLTQGHICLLCFHLKYCYRLSISIFLILSMGRVPSCLVS